MKTLARNISRFSLLILFSGIFMGTIFAQQQGETDYKEVEFNQDLENTLFPGWKGEGETEEDTEAISGVIGENADGKRAFQYIPRITDLLLKFLAPIMVGLVIFAGLRFIYAGSDEEEITKSKNFFIYASIGLLFIVLSYSIMRAVYFLLSNG